MVQVMELEGQVLLIPSVETLILQLELAAAVVVPVQVGLLLEDRVALA
jgi:hypothetical protein